MSRINFRRFLLASAAILAMPASGWAQTGTVATTAAAPSGVQTAKEADTKKSDTKAGKTAKTGNTQLASGTQVAAAGATQIAAVSDPQASAAGDAQSAATSGVQVAAKP